MRLARPDRVHDLQHDRRGLGGTGQVRAHHGIAVQPRQIGGGQVEVGDDVLGQHAADGVEQDNIERRGRLGDLEARGQVLGYGAHD